MSFSGAVQLTGLDDYITPSQACVLPVRSEPLKRSQAPSDARASTSDEGADDKRRKVVLDETSGGYVELHADGHREELKPASITLTDCLACSGCITSAESVLITAQSKDEFYTRLDDKSLRVVVSLSPQARASIAAHFDVDLETAHRQLTRFLRETLGVEHVLDTSLTRELSLVETCVEFVDRFRHKSDDKPLPMLSSKCPGWVCYAEKTHGTYVLPYISTAKSPQQVMGSFVKSRFAALHDIDPSQIYHVTVMPCFDKKLEASRTEFADEESGRRDVDCVLSSGEILECINEKGFDFRRPPPDVTAQPLSEYTFADESKMRLKGPPGGSDAFVETVFRFAAQELFGVNLADKPLEYKRLRNDDMKELTLKVDGEVKLRFALAYGFRNIQNLVRRIKSKRSKYDFVEIMACPRGCLNGGGQIRPPDENVETPKERLAKVDRAYHSAQRTLGSQPGHMSDARVLELYREWVGVEQPSLEGLCGPTSDERRRSLLHTSYRAVEQNVLTTTVAMQW